MRFRRSIHLPCAMEACMVHLLDPRLMVHVAAPVVQFRFIDPPNLPSSWKERSYDVGLRLFGRFPLGRQTIRISVVSWTPERVEMRDNGSSARIARWDHHILLAPCGNGCTYTDALDIDAGVLTPLVWLFAWFFFGHRQRRLKRLAKSGFHFCG